MHLQHRPSYTPSVQELRALVYCADLGSVSRAAGALSLTQSAVSRSIRALEDRLGVRLFHRVKKRLVLSEAGRALVHESRDILTRLDASAQMAMSFGEEGDVLRIAVLPTFAATWLIPRLPTFVKTYPEISIDISSALHPVDFDFSPFDAAVQRAVMARKDTTVIPIMEEELITVASPNLLPDGDEVCLEDLSDYPFIQLATRPNLWNDWFLHVGLESRDRLKGPRFQHFDMVISAAQAGLGLAVLPSIFARQSILMGTLKQVHSNKMLGPSPYALIQPAQARDSASRDAFAQWLAEMNKFE